MADSKTPNDTPALTAADVAKKVKRTTTIEAAGAEPRTVTEPIATDEVLAWRDYGTHVVVVTKDGKKHSNEAQA